MDIISIELGVGLFLLFVVPVIYAVTYQSKKEKQTIKKIEALYASQNIKITKSAVFQTLFLGIDEQSKHLVTTTLPIQVSRVRLISLNEIKQVSLIKIEVPKPGQPKAKTIEKVAVELVFKTKEKSPFQIVFFDDELGLDPHQSIVQANEWVDEIKKHL